MGCFFNGKEMGGKFGRHVLLSAKMAHEWNGCEKKGDKGILYFTFFPFHQQTFCNGYMLFLLYMLDVKNLMV